MNPLLGALSSGKLNFGTLPNLMLGGIANPPSGQSNPGMGALLNFAQPALSGGSPTSTGSAMGAAPATPTLGSSPTDSAQSQMMQQLPQLQQGGGTDPWHLLIQMLLHNFGMISGGGQQSNMFSNMTNFPSPGSGIYGR